jgi:hypothetical protein
MSAAALSIGATARAFPWDAILIICAKMGFELVAEVSIIIINQLYYAAAYMSIVNVA